MESKARLLDLVSMVYDTVERPNSWNAFLEGFADAVGGFATSLILYTPESRLGDVPAAIRLDPGALRAYTDYYVQTDTWGIYGSHLLTPGAVLLGQELCADHLLQTSEFYADFCQPSDIHHQFCGVVARQGPAISLIASTRPRRNGAFAEEERRLLAVLLPHLQRALSLHYRLGDIAAENRWHAENLDRLPFGVAMISAQGSVLQLNASAQHMLAGNDGLSCDAGGLVALRADESVRLNSLIKAAILTGVGTGLDAGGSASVSRPSGRRAYRLLVSPFRSTARQPGPTQPAATVFIFDPHRETEGANSVLARLYGLTPGEIRVATMLMHGLDIAEAADKLGIARSTTRNVVKRLFMKTGTNRQAELVRELLVGPAQVSR